MLSVLLLISRDVGIFVVLQEATLNSSEEGVCRAARGALWVIKTTTGKSPVKKSGRIFC